MGSWKEVVKGEDETKVFMALDGVQYTWRTASAIARQTNLNEQQVWDILKKYSGDFVRLSETPSASGDLLVGLIEKVGG